MKKPKGMKIVQYYYHEQLTSLDDTGFGVIYEPKPSTYMPPTGTKRWN